MSVVNLSKSLACLYYQGTLQKVYVFVMQVTLLVVINVQSLPSSWYFQSKYMIEQVSCVNKERNYSDIVIL